MQWRALSITGHTDRHILRHWTKYGASNEDTQLKTDSVPENKNELQAMRGKTKTKTKTARMEEWKQPPPRSSYAWKHAGIKPKGNIGKGEIGQTYASVELRTSSLDKTPPMLLTRWLAPCFAIQNSSNLNPRVFLESEKSRCDMNVMYKYRMQPAQPEVPVVVPARRRCKIECDSECECRPRCVLLQVVESRRAKLV